MQRVIASPCKCVVSLSDAKYIYIWMWSVCEAYISWINIYIPFISLPFQLLFMILKSTWMDTCLLDYYLQIWLNELTFRQQIVQLKSLLELNFLDNTLCKLKLPTSINIHVSSDRYEPFILNFMLFP